jgi:ABC-type glycerol-3-phosphate transport system substrate-binding protein
MSTFQIVVLGIFASLILLGIGVFATLGGVFSGKSIGSVTIWGTLDQRTIDEVLGNLRIDDKSLQGVHYVQKDKATYNAELVNAMASGSGPDLFMLAGDDLYSFRDKILTIPYNIIPQGSYLASFVDEGTLFLTKDGEVALPLMLDPLVMYWNRDLFASAGLANPPKFWNDFIDIAPKITSIDVSATVKKSAVSLGEWRNIPNAKAILSSIIMQVGDNIVTAGENGKAKVVLGQAAENTTRNPTESVLQFYTEFANPTKTSYSWNRSLPNAFDMFTAGDLAAYFGFASEYATIAERNPNLRYSAAVLPQIEGNSTRLTFGKITGLAIPRTSKNVDGALAVARKLTDKDPVALISGALSLPPVRRDVAVDASANASAGVFVESSLIARGWLDPNQKESSSIFQTMIESVVSGKSTTDAAIREGAQSLEQLLPAE